MNTRRGSYDPRKPVTLHNTINPVSIRSMDGKPRQYNQRPDSVSGSITTDRESKRQECCFALFLKVENFKEYLSEISCCAWVNNIPLVAFLVGISVLLVVLIILPFLIASFIIRSHTSVSNTKDQPNWPNVVDLSPHFRSLKSMVPPNVTLCEGYGFTCTNLPSLVIGTLQRCDGVDDCPDGSDEIGCKLCHTTVNCSSETYGTILPRYALCLRGYRLCDGNVDCPDGSDEGHYCRKECSRDEVRCGYTSTCLGYEQKCDGDVQCKYGEDEKNCDGKCRGGALWCEGKKKCIPKWQICDGVQNCPGGSDEMGCTCRECSGIGKALCNSSNFCIERSQVCDGNEDCPGGDDEMNCPGGCIAGSKKDFIRCRDGRLYHRKYACSGILNECEGNCNECFEEIAFTCNNHKCIKKSLVCDGLDDCGDNSDETNCNCTLMKRSGHTMQCMMHTRSGTTKCILLSQRCDGYEDCPNGEDEKNCEECVNPNAVYCNPTKTCLVSTKRCDGVTDCPDNNDEQQCGCEECRIHGFPIYMCTNAARCFKRHEVCNPYTQCPNASKVDKLFCASQARKNTFLAAKKKV